MRSHSLFVFASAGSAHYYRSLPTSREFEGTAYPHSPHLGPSPIAMSSYTLSKNPPSAPHGSDGDSDDAAAAPPVITSRLYLHRPGPGSAALDRDAVLQRIRHRRRHHRLRDTLRSMLVQAPPEPEREPENAGVERQHLPWPLDDAFSAP